MKERIWALSLGVALVAVAASVATAGEPFFDAALGYSIDIPQDWTLSRPDDYTVRLGGPDGVFVKIQNIASTAIGGLYDGVDALASSLRCQLVSTADSICIYGGGVLNAWDTDGAHLDGIQFVAEYVWQGSSAKEWTAIVEHASGSVLYVVSFTAPGDVYANHEPAVVEMIRSWTIGGVSETGPAVPGVTTSADGGDIVVILMDRGHIGPYRYSESTYDKRFYEFTLSAPGYVALCVVDEAGEAITGWILSPDGSEVTQKPGNVADVYTSCYAVVPGTYTVKVGQDNMVTESDFEMAVYFRLAPFSIDDLALRFGPRVRVLP